MTPVEKQIAVLWFVWALSLGPMVGTLVERWRWLRWAKRNHPDEVDTTWL